MAFNNLMRSMDANIRKMDNIQMLLIEIKSLYLKKSNSVLQLQDENVQLPKTDLQMVIKSSEKESVSSSKVNGSAVEGSILGPPPGIMLQYDRVSDDDEGADIQHKNQITDIGAPDVAGDTDGDVLNCSALIKNKNLTQESGSSEGILGPSFGDFSHGSVNKIEETTILSKEQFEDHFVKGLNNESKHHVQMFHPTELPHDSFLAGLLAATIDSVVKGSKPSARIKSPTNFSHESRSVSLLVNHLGCPLFTTSTLWGFVVDRGKPLSGRPCSKFKGVIQTANDVSLLPKLLDVKETTRAEQLIHHWEGRNASVKSNIKDLLLRTVGSVVSMEGHNAAQVIVKVASIEFLLKERPPLVVSLLSNMTQVDKPASLKQFTLETLEFVRDETFNQEVMQGEVNSVFTIVVQGTILADHSAEVCLTATRALYSALAFLTEDVLHLLKAASRPEVIDAWITFDRGKIGNKDVGVIGVMAEIHALSIINKLTVAAMALFFY